MDVGRLMIRAGDCGHVCQSIKGGFKLGKKIRIIFGCDEESGWECMDYYFKYEPGRVWVSRIQFLD